MDDILASIRRILSDEENAGKAPSASEGVLMLDQSMMVDESAPNDAPERADEPHSMTGLEPTHPTSDRSDAPEHDPAHDLAHDEQPEQTDVAGSPDQAALERIAQPESLVAPAAAAAAASSVGTLMRTLVAERNSLVHRGGPSIEDLVREETRPLLKDWLDAHLPSLVERLVRAEIERVVGRITG